MIKWLFKWFRGKPVPKYLSGKKEEAAKRDIEDREDEKPADPSHVIGHVML